MNREYHVYFHFTPITVNGSIALTIKDDRELQKLAKETTELQQEREKLQQSLQDQTNKQP